MSSGPVPDPVGTAAAAAATDKDGGVINIVRFLLQRHGLRNAGAATASSADPTPEILLTRRVVHELIAAGCVQVDGAVVTDAQNCVVSPSSVVVVAPDALARVREAIRIWAFEKPVSMDSNLNDGDRSSIVHVLKKTSLHSLGVVPIGRLDKDSQGLLLLTNSGILNERIGAAGDSHEKEYVVQTSTTAPFTAEFLAAMRQGVTWASTSSKKQSGATETSMPCVVEPVVVLRRVVDGGATTEETQQPQNEQQPSSSAPNETTSAAAPKVVRMRKVPRGEGQQGQQCFRIVLTQGLNRQIRNMVEAASKGAFRVTYLRRVRVGPVHIDDIFADGCDDEPVEILGAAREALLAWAFSSHAQRREREE